MRKRIVIAFLIIPLLSFGQLSLPAIFADNMILQRNQPVAMWGNAEPGKIITIKVLRQVHNATADKNGRWKVVLKPFKVGAAFELLVSAANEKTIRLVNIKVGDVWICAGQSNMNFMLAAEQDGPGEIANINNDDIREYRTAMPAGVLNPENVDNSKWESARGQDAAKFSALAYYFAKQLQTEENIPIGIVVMACGNTRAESWTNTAALEQQPLLKPLLAYWDKKKNDRDANPNHIPGKFYADVVAPIIPFSAKGVIWYQGESNTLPDGSERSIADRAAEYKTLLQTLINSWRTAWNKPVLPFCIVQLPNYSDASGNIHWADIRQAQLQTSKELNNVGMITTIDVGDTHNIHPVNKKTVGHRVALWASVNIYHNQKHVASGPLIKKIAIRGDNAILDFDCIGRGLTIKNHDTLVGFEMADTAAPNSFITASAVIIHNKILLKVKGISRPAAVRYAWADDPIASLYNTSGLPASPFIIKK
ncbi:sialate O-acetylesterase [Mucilaginibacter sp.]|uniref:sialate O-acetylesterase n=1 Tax=Mucilaginibacter sp. TaxID=1882438 RepID=UPI0025FD9B4E|nr:sialate O-acetylesterase [Mucilaginibacter sp.]